MDEYGREPCPHRIYSDVGSAFGLGLFGGAIFQTYSGYKKGPTGFMPKLLSAAREIRMRSPVTGVQFAAWGGMFSTIECGLVAVRKKEDPWNSITAGGATGALLCMRMGPTAMVASGVFGALILGMIEGAGLLMNRYSSIFMGPPPEEPTMPLSGKEKQQQVGGGSTVHSTNFSEPSPSNAATPFGMAQHH